jgi:hypothetical protein
LLQPWLSKAGCSAPHSPPETGRIEVSMHIKKDLTTAMQTAANEVGSQILTPSMESVSAFREIATSLIAAVWASFQYLDSRTYSWQRCNRWTFETPDKSLFQQVRHLQLIAAESRLQREEEMVVLTQKRH